MASKRVGVAAPAAPVATVGAVAPQQPVAPPVAPQVIPQLTREQLLAQIAALPVSERSAIVKETQVIAKEARANLRGAVEACGVSPDDPTLVQIDVRLGSAPIGTADRGMTGDGRRYLFAHDAVRFTAFGIEWQMGSNFATEFVAKTPGTGRGRR